VSDVSDAYPQIDTNKITIGVTSVPVLVNDNGNEVNCTMYAGHVILEVINGNTVKPRADWCIAASP
jgi:hypothetical protein